MKTDDQGLSVPRVIFRAILIAGIATGINSVHAASISNTNNNNSNVGAVNVKQVDDSNHNDNKITQIQNDKNQSDSSSIGQSTTTTEGSITPRSLEPRGVRYKTCPVCQSSSFEFSGYGGSSHHHYAGGGGGGGGRGVRGGVGSRSVGGGSRHFGSGRSQCGGGSRCGAQGRHQHFDEDYDDDADDDDGYEEEYGHRIEHEDPDLGYIAPVHRDDFDLDFDDSDFHLASKNPYEGTSFTTVKRFGGGGCGGGGRSRLNIIRSVNRGNGFGSGRGNVLFGSGGYSEEYKTHGDTSHLDDDEDDPGYGNMPSLDNDNDDERNAGMSYNFGSMDFGNTLPNFFSPPSVRKRLVVDSSNKNGYMLPNEVLNAVQELGNDPSQFYVTFACQPKIGKYICKIQCAKRENGMTAGSCESGYCVCLFKEEKDMRKKMNKRFLAGVKGFKHDCLNDAKHCKRFCKSLTPDKSFTGVCTDNFCKCVTYPHNPDKKSACQKAIKKLKKIEDMALIILGVPTIQTGPPDSKANAATDKIMNHIKASNNMEGCTPEDYESLRGIISNLTQRLKFAKKSGAKTPLRPSTKQPEEKATVIGTITRSWDTHHAGDETPTRKADRGPGGPASPPRRSGYVPSFPGPLSEDADLDYDPMERSLRR